MRRRIRASCDLGAPPAEVWRVLADVESYPTWLDGVTRVDVLAQEGDLSVARLEGDAGQLVAELLSTPPTRLEANEVGKLRDGWTVALSLSSSGGDGCRVTVEATTPSRWLVASTRRPRQAFGRAAAALTRRMGGSAERPRAPEPSLSADRRLLLELRRRPDGCLELWIDGTTIQLSSGEAG